MRLTRKLFAILLILIVLCGLSVTAFADGDGSPTTKTYKDNNGETITEIYDENGILIHKEEPYYKDGKKSGTLCYDAFIECRFSDETYTTTSSWILPVIQPEVTLDKCLSFTLNLAYYMIEDPKGLGTQVIYCRQNGIFKKVGYLDMNELNEIYSIDFKFEKPKKIDGFALMAYKPSKTGSISLGSGLTDVYYLK